MLLAGFSWFINQTGTLFGDEQASDHGLVFFGLEMNEGVVKRTSGWWFDVSLLVFLFSNLFSRALQPGFVLQI